MSGKVYPVPGGDWRTRAFIDETAYKTLYERSIADPAGLWGEVVRRIDWIKPYIN